MDFDSDGEQESDHRDRDSAEDHQQRILKLHSGDRDKEEEGRVSALIKITPRDNETSECLSLHSTRNFGLLLA